MVQNQSGHIIILRYWVWRQDEPIPYVLIRHVELSEKQIYVKKTKKNKTISIQLTKNLNFWLENELELK